VTALRDRPGDCHAARRVRSPDAGSLSPLALALVVAALLALLPGCAASAAPPDVPAVVTNPSARTRAELQRMVGALLGDPAILLADDALVTSNTLLVERRRHRDGAGRLLDGRDTGRPERFDLVRQGRRCVLVHAGSGERRMLRTARC
jgi:hypothetical protein